MRPVTDPIHLVGTVVLGLLLSSTSLAEPVDIQQAAKVSEAFLRTRNSRPPKDLRVLSASDAQEISARLLSPTAVREIRGNDGRLLAYLTTLKPEGFVVTSTDTDIAPVIAYSFRGAFPLDDADHPLLRLLTGDAELLLAAVPEYGKPHKAENNARWQVYLADNVGYPGGRALRQWPEEGTTSTGGWVETTWHQGSPYNKFCPLDAQTGQRSWAGCTAIAIAQIVNYHRCLNTPVFDSRDSYESNGIRIDEDHLVYDYPSFDLLNQFLQNAQSKYDKNVPLGDDDYAAITFACGVALRSTYSSISTLHFSGETHTLLEKFHYYSANYRNVYDDFYPLLKDNLTNGFPVLLDISQSGAATGHSIVVDGYNTEDFYHVNFGQGQLGTAWVLMPQGFPPAYNMINGGLLDIVPAEGAYPNFVHVDTGRVCIGGTHYGDEPVRRICVGGAYVGETRVADFTLTNVTDDYADVNLVCCSDGFMISRTADRFLPDFENLRISPREAQTIHMQFTPNAAGSFAGEIILEVRTRTGVQFVPIAAKGYGVPQGATIVDGGVISGTWTKRQSPYFVCGNVTVAELTIEPGVTIKFFDYELDVPPTGQLKAVGSADNKIIFTAADPNLGWKGISVVSSQARFSFCEISHATVNNDPYSSTGLSAALTITGASPVVTNNVMTNNLDCVLINGNSCPLVTGNILCGNRGCGLVLLSGPSADCTVYSNVIANNDLDGIHAYLAIGRIMNNTVVNNGRTGLRCWESSSPLVRNNIFWGNGREMPKQIELVDTTCRPRMEYNDIEGGMKGLDMPQDAIVDVGEGNIDDDPRFVNPAPRSGKEDDALLRDWHLQGNSPCINAGDPGYLGATNEVDIDGDPRVMGGRIDIGADECSH